MKKLRGRSSITDAAVTNPSITDPDSVYRYLDAQIQKAMRDKDAGRLSRSTQRARRLEVPSQFWSSAMRFPRRALHFYCGNTPWLVLHSIALLDTKLRAVSQTLDWIILGLLIINSPPSISAVYHLATIAGTLSHSMSVAFGKVVMCKWRCSIIALTLAAISFSFNSTPSSVNEASIGQHHTINDSSCPPLVIDPFDGRDTWQEQIPWLLAGLDSVEATIEGMVIQAILFADEDFIEGVSAAERLDSLAYDTEKHFRSIHAFLSYIQGDLDSNSQLWSRNPEQARNSMYDQWLLRVLDMPDSYELSSSTYLETISLVLDLTKRLMVMTEAKAAAMDILMPRHSPSGPRKLKSTVKEHVRYEYNRIMQGCCMIIPHYEAYQSWHQELYGAWFDFVRHSAHAHGKMSLKMQLFEIDEAS